MRTLTKIADADRFIASADAVWIYKHSVTCGVSSAAHDEVEAYTQKHPGEPLAMVIVQDHREVSNHLAEKLGVRHASPQVLLVRRGKSLWDTSHYKITADAMSAARRAAAR
jgi:bacillithiol system protein YtxJ